jgi:hypothetical protein
MIFSSLKENENTMVRNPSDVMLSGREASAF